MDALVFLILAGGVFTLLLSDDPDRRWNSVIVIAIAAFVLICL